MQFVKQVSKLLENIMHANYVNGKKLNIYRHEVFCYVDMKYCITAMEREA